jgi:ribonuclease D
VALLKVLLAASAEAHHVAPKLLADTEDLERLASESEPDVRAPARLAARGVRRRCAGAQDRQLALGVAGRRVRLIRTP